ncbi:hypothetical protein [Stieleria mannarensis]|uniref:hypothetical protein n=1 Tax=Stieleria mannarensis TaxID=2755585 RepID=UPI0025700AA2|nr:hypothetical protein [Rhodopirellula sp. JC639]
MQAPALMLAITAAVITQCGCALPTGILRSRWAMDDPEYAEKYCDGAEKSDPLGKLKQAVDARFLEDADGIFVSGGYTQRSDADNGLFAIDIGAETYFASYLTGRASLMGMGNGEDWFTGVDTGLRLQTPSRLAPFVGAGVYGGFAKEVVSADDDWKDNDDDGFIDEHGEDEERISGALAAFYPELGGHFWWTPQIRLTGYGRYMISTEGRDADDWILGVGLAVFTNRSRR